MTLGEIMIAGAFSALPSTVVTSPVERVKCLLQIQGEEARLLSNVENNRQTFVLMGAGGWRYQIAFRRRRSFFQGS